MLIIIWHTLMVALCKTSELTYHQLVLDLTLMCGCLKESGWEGLESFKDQPLVIVGQLCNQSLKDTEGRRGGRGA